MWPLSGEVVCRPRTRHRRNVDCNQISFVRPRRRSCRSRSYCWRVMRSTDGEPLPQTEPSKCTMLIRIVVFVSVVSLLSAPLQGQSRGTTSQMRVRITGSHAYEIPGVLKVEDGRMTGNASITTDELTMRVEVLTTRQLLVAPKPGKRLVGVVSNVRNGVASFQPEGQQEILAIPLESIGRLEVSTRRTRAHPLRGILLGLAACFGVSVLVFHGGNSWDTTAPTISGIAAGTAVGVITGRGREMWRTEPTAWLSSQFSGSSGRSDTLSPAHASPPRGW